MLDFSLDEVLQAVRRKLHEYSTCRQERHEAMSDHVVQTVGLTAIWRPGPVNSLHLAVPRAGIFAFLGRNGSARALRCACCWGCWNPRGAAPPYWQDCQHYPPDAGPDRLHGEGHPLYGWMRVDECSWFQSRFTQLEQTRISSRADHFRLSERAKVKDLSRASGRAVPGPHAAPNLNCCAGRAGIRAGPGCPAVRWSSR